MVEAPRVTVSVLPVNIVVGPVKGGSVVSRAVLAARVVASDVTELDDKTNVRQQCSKMTPTRVTFFQCIVEMCSGSNKKTVITLLY